MSIIHRQPRSDRGKPRAKRPDSRVGRIRTFYETNPDEELTYEQMAIKFGCTVQQCQFAVKMLGKELDIESVHVIRMRAKGLHRD